MGAAVLQGSGVVDVGAALFHPLAPEFSDLLCGSRNEWVDLNVLKMGIRDTNPRVDGEKRERRGWKKKP